nr:hypothetical protein [Saprospiraceae bacterium]
MRMPGWNYSDNGYYYITLVTQNRECNLGRIVKGKMTYSDFGRIVKQEWLKSFEIRHELFLNQWVIMPNHLHAIVILKNTKKSNDGEIGDGAKQRSNRSNHSNDLGQSPPSKLVRSPKSISSFVGGFKSAVNSKINDYIDAHQLKIPKYNRKNHFFQNNYHDHIIRNQEEYIRIKYYIINNPGNWEGDNMIGG